MWMKWNPQGNTIPSTSSFFLRCPFSPVALYSSFAEIVTLTASLQLDIVITASFRHAILFDGTLRFIAVFANFTINRTVWLLDIQSRTTAETISRECQSLSVKPPFCFSTAGADLYQINRILFKYICCYQLYLSFGWENSKMTWKCHNSNTMGVRLGNHKMLQLRTKVVSGLQNLRLTFIVENMYKKIIIKMKLEFKNFVYVK